MGLHETVVDNIDAVGLLTEEGADLLGANSSHERLLGLRALGIVCWEHVFGSINILAEVVVVDLLGVTAVAVTTSDQIEMFVAGRHDVQTFHDTEELLSSDVLLGGAIEILEAWLEVNSVGNDVGVKSSHHSDHLFFISIVENLFEFKMV